MKETPIRATAEAARPKWADTEPEVLEVIRARWSPRAFSDESISDHDLKVVLEAGRWAASSYNEQPWRFLVARKSDPHFGNFVDLLSPFNQVWAKNAAVLIIMAYKTTFTHNGSPNRYGLHDAGQALAHLMLQATALGIHAHGIAGFDAERAKSELGIPDGYGMGAAVALGYAGNAESLPEQYRVSELASRTRKPLSDIVFGGLWEQSLTL